MPMGQDGAQTTRNSLLFLVQACCNGRMNMPANSTKKPWFVYMVRTAAGALYTGVSTDVARRFAEHQEGGPKAAKALKGKGPLCLVYQEQAADKVSAMQREYALKKLNKAAKEALVSSVNKVC